MRNFHQGFKNGMYAGMFNTVLQEIFDGGLRNRVPSHAGYENLRPVASLPADGGPEAHMLGPAKGDGKLTFDKLTDLYYSGTKHEEDQPAHLLIQDTNICNDRCVKEFGEPVPELLPRERLRDGRRFRRAQWQAHQPESRQLRALQDLRHSGPLPDHYLGSTRGRRRPELRRDVKTALSNSQAHFALAGPGAHLKP